MLPHSVHSDAALLMQAQAGDAGAFKDLYDRYATTLYRIALAGTRSEADAADLLQECFLRFYQHIGKIEKHDNVGAWLYVTMRNRLIDLYAKERSKVKYIAAQRYRPAESGEHVYSMLRAKEISACIAQALEAMPEKTREVYKLSREQQMTIGEIAEMLGRSEQTIKNQLHTATTKLRQALRDRGLTAWIIFI